MNEQEVITLYHQHRNIHEVARALGKSSAYVKKVLQKHNVKLK